MSLQFGFHAGKPIRPDILDMLQDVSFLEDLDVGKCGRRAKRMPGICPAMAERSMLLGSFFQDRPDAVADNRPEDGG